MAAKAQRVSFWLDFFTQWRAVQRAKIFIDTSHGSWDSAQSRRGASGKGRCTVDWETELMAAFETVVHRDFPNPQHIGCPGREFLEALAAGRRDDQSAPILAHIRECAACFDQLKQLRATNRR